MSTITFVTGNANKLREVVAILSTSTSSRNPSTDSSSSEVNTVGKFTIENRALDLDEVQGTTESIIIHKARSAASIIGGPVLVEDTCLGFDAYKQLPGPYIKWFVSALGLDGLVKMLDGFEDKSASAICTFGYCSGPGADGEEPEVKVFQGVTRGKIVQSRGPTNFGWDSVFQPDGYEETYAEMDKSVKNSISHRYKALDKVREYLLSL
ncbi:nucleoside triphosphate pyrophosphohydrolase ham1 [Lodderomyces elongisporus]|uniref:nucleoside triphosphate pyrophosphohydrolase ham1 n=1 Tax=Lodderomyces elongisporus TaxID=36914 RepID=UPI002923358F|nr:nucleoside triphosphate pyrophosphohydrolase ham1 [Lodderomyces elongisporus]WLF80900.1 nucleoside triphosphate pyrophosphohydrolase ham1 [Lodderomyces elongisporus]